MNSLSSSVMFTYTMDILMQPRSGDMSASAHRPQKANSRAIAMIRRLSVERFLSSALITTPNSAPTAIAATLVARGRRMFPTSTLPPDSEATATDMAME